MRAQQQEVVDVEGGGGAGVFTRGGHRASAPYGIPAAIRIRGMSYRLEFHTQIYDERGGRLLGIVNFARRLITVDPDRPRWEVLRTIGHEAAHVYLAHAQQVDARIKKLTHGQLEAFCDLFAEAHLDLEGLPRG